MLDIYFYNDDGTYDVNGKEIIGDIEEAFYDIKLTCTEEEKRIVNEIEHGELIDNSRFKDRFGCTLYIRDLSTGCKAGLIVLHNKDKVLDCIECGNNARDVIIRHCKEGGILIVDNGVSIRYPYGDKGLCNVRLDEREFYTIDKLNSYIRNEMWLKIKP